MRRLLNALPLLLSLVPFGAASAEEKVIEKHVIVDWREAQIVKLDGMAASVVVGDPTVADVSLEDPQTVILFGKGPGETNLLVFGSDHQLLLSSSVTVNPEVARHVSILGAAKGAEVLYSCGSRCVRILSPTDIEFESKIKTETKSEAATGQNTQEKSEVSSDQSGGTGPVPAP